MTIVRLEPMRDDDRAFVLDSWLRSYLAARREDSYPGSRAIVVAAMHLGSVLVALVPETERQIAGWCCTQFTPRGIVLHYVYVKNLFRSHGIASLLIKASLGGATDAEYSFDTPQFHGLMRGLKRRKAGITWSPYVSSSSSSRPPLKSSTSSSAASQSEE